MHGRHHHETKAVGDRIGVTVGSIMSSPAVTLPGEVTSADALHQLGHQAHDAYPVIGHDGQAIGLLSTNVLRHTLHYCYSTLVKEIADTDPELIVEPWLDAGLLLDNASFLRAGHAVVVNRNRNPVGIVSEGDVLRAAQVARDATAEADSELPAGPQVDDLPGANQHGFPGSHPDRRQLSIV